MYYVSWVMCHVSLNFFVLAQWDDLFDLGSVTTRPRISQVMNNKEASRLSLTDVFVNFIMSTIYFLCVHLIQRRSSDQCWLVSKNRLRQEMHMKRLSDEMLEHTINILACLSFVWLKDFEDLVWNTFYYKQPFLLEMNPKHV